MVLDEALVLAVGVGWALVAKGREVVVVVGRDCCWAAASAFNFILSSSVLQDKRSCSSSSQSLS